MFEVFLPLTLMICFDHHEGNGLFFSFKV